MNNIVKFPCRRHRHVVEVSESYDDAGNLIICFDIFDDQKVRCLATAKNMQEAVEETMKLIWRGYWISVPYHVDDCRLVAP